MPFIYKHLGEDGAEGPHDEDGEEYGEHRKQSELGKTPEEEEERSIRVFLVENFFSLAIDAWHRHPGAVQILGEKCHEDNCPAIEAISEPYVSTMATFG